LLTLIVALSLASQSGWDGKQIKAEDVAEKVRFTPYVLAGTHENDAAHHVVWVPPDLMSGVPNGFILLGSKISHDDKEMVIVQMKILPLKKSLKPEFEDAEQQSKYVLGYLIGVGFFREFNLGQYKYRAIRKLGDVLVCTLSNQDIHTKELKFQKWKK